MAQQKVQPGAAAEDAEGAASDLEASCVPEVASDVPEACEETPVLRLEACEETTMRRPSDAGKRRGTPSKQKWAMLHPCGLGGDVEQASKPHRGIGSNLYIKWVAVAVLVFQKAGTNVIMPLARRTEWNSQSGVISAEIAKGAVSVLALLWGGGFANLAEALRPTPEALRTAVPALLFLLQNNLQYIAAGYLTPTLFACLNQLKILSAALLSMLLLQKNIRWTDWAALVILVVGAALVALDHVKPKKGKQFDNESGIWFGVVILILATFLASLAGVDLEKLLKGSTVTLAARNLQLSCYSAVIGLIVFSQSGGSLASFFNGYTAIVWVSICNAALCGFLVAAVIKYADNIWKHIAPTLSIVLTSFVQALFLGQSLGLGELLGVALVITAVLLYSGVCFHVRAIARGHRPPGPPVAPPPGPLPEAIGRSSVELKRPGEVEVK